MTTASPGPQQHATPLTPMQRMTIDGLRRGQQDKIPVTLTAEARVDRLLAARGDFAADGAKVTITVLLARILARTLADHPAVSATIVEDAVVRRRDVNLCVAVAAADGSLSVPVIPGAQDRTVPELAQIIDELAARARARKLGLEHVRGGTFTLSSTGMVRLPVFGTPVLVPGQSGILLAACAAQRPVVEDGALAVGTVMPLSLTFDHTVVNGVPALRFLGDLVARIEQPADWLS